MKRKMTTPEFLASLIDNQNPMLMMVIHQAIHNYTSACLLEGEGCLGAASAMISEAAWLQACQYIQTSFTSHSDPASPRFMVDVEEELADVEDDDPEGFEVALPCSSLQALRAAAQGAITALENPMACRPTVTLAQLHKALSLTAGAQVR